MIRYENDCCNCASPGYPCRGEACELRHSPHYYCNDCGGEFSDDELFVYDNDVHLCLSCLADRFDRVVDLI